jgi:pimeloyl-ACP methyl ester carboxylesterase
MRERRFFFLLLTFLLLPPMVLSQKESATTTAKAAAPDGVKPTPDAAPVPEKWSVLNDIKSGLQPRAPMIVATDEKPEFTRELVRLQWRMADPIDVWIMRPKTQAKVPVILYLYSYPNDPEQFRNDGWCTRATAGGFAAVGFTSALTGERYHFRPMKQWFVSELQESLGSSVHDVQLILNYLATRPDLDVEHVGIFGMGSGATIALLAAQADPRIKTVDALDPWGDWPDWLRESPAVPANERPKYMTQDFLKLVAPVDPVIYMPYLKTPSVRLQQTLTDPVTPKAVQERIAHASRSPAEVVKYATPEDHLKAWQSGGLSGWIKQQLRAQLQEEQKDNHNAALNSDSR